jgi:hypothetical protein
LKSTQGQRPPSFFLTKNIPAAQRDLEGRIQLLAKAEFKIRMIRKVFNSQIYEYIFKLGILGRNLSQRCRRRGNQNFEGINWDLLMSRESRS